MFCKNCGQELSSAAVVCPACGCLTGFEELKNQQNVNQPQQPGPYQQQNQFQQNPYQQNQYQQNPNNAPYQREDVTNAGLVVVCVLVPIVGIILGIVNMNNGLRNSGKNYLIAGIISIVISTVSSVLLATGILGGAFFHYYL